MTPSTRLIAWFNVAMLAAAMAAVCALLWPQWLHNPDLAHGLFMPVVFPILLFEGWRTGGHGPFGGTLAVGILTAAGVAALGAAGLYASVLGWSHSLALFSLAASLALLLLAAFAAFSGKRGGPDPFNWPAAVAAGLWLLCAPIPSGTYARITLALQLGVSSGVLGALHLLGIAAVRHGNIIELANAMVGIEEACSGVRSLVSCVFAGLFFSATLVRRPGSRLLIVALSVPLALVMNLIRSLALTLMANDGIRIAESWHDLTGYAVLGLTGAVLGALALRIGRGDAREGSVPAEWVPAAGPQRILALGLALGAAFGAIFLSNARALPPVARPAPDLAAILPAGAPGWRTVDNKEVAAFAGVLGTTALAQRTYLGNGRDGEVEIIAYLAYWPAGAASVSSVDLHTPDLCWPAAGWVLEPAGRSREALSVGGRALPEAEYRFLKYGGVVPQNVWFWHLYGGRPVAYRNPYSPRELLGIALRYGFRRDGDQLFVRISSNRPWSGIEGEPLMRELFRGLAPLGL